MAMACRSATGFSSKTTAALLPSPSKREKPAKSITFRPALLNPISTSSAPFSNFSASLNPSCNTSKTALTLSIVPGFSVNSAGSPWSPLKTASAAPLIGIAPTLPGCSTPALANTATITNATTSSARRLLAVSTFEQKKCPFPNPNSPPPHPHRLWAILPAAPGSASHGFLLLVSSCSARSLASSATLFPTTTPPTPSSSPPSVCGCSILSAAASLPLSTPTSLLASRYSSPARWPPPWRSSPVLTGALSTSSLSTSLPSCSCG